MNKEELRIYHREWKRKKRLDPEFRKNASKIHRKWASSEKGKVWIKNNNHKYLPLKLAANRRRRLLKKNVVGTHSKVQWEWLKAEYGHCCAICGMPEAELAKKWSRPDFQKLTKDHIHPLSKGGSDHIWNIQPVCISCNAKRCNRVTIGFTASAFDFFHAGHVEMLREAKTKCDVLIVGLHTNPQIDRPSKNKPLQTTFERYLQVAGSGFVHEIIPYDTEKDLLDMLKSLKPDIRIIGEEYREKDFTGKDLDIPIYYNSRSHTFSSTELRNRLK